MDVFKAVVASIPVVIVLSIIVWVIMYYAFPNAPLTTAETVLIIFVITVIATAVKAFLKKRRGQDGEAKNEPTK